MDTLGALVLLAAGLLAAAWSVREYRRDRAWDRAVREALAVAARTDERAATVQALLEHHPGRVRVWRANEVRRATEAERGERP